MLAPLPPPTDPLPRPTREIGLLSFLWGFSLPFQIAKRIRRRDPETWTSWRRVAFWQTIATACLGASFLTAIVLVGAAVLRWAATKGEVRVTGLQDWREITVAIFAVFSFAEGIVVAWSREHHEQIGRGMTESFALPPEDPPMAPRLRLSARWIWRRIRRWGRGVRALLGALPSLLLVSLLFYPLKLHGRALPLLAVAWSIYWAVIIACGKTAYAWRSEGDPNALAPAYVRRFARVPILSLFARFLGWMTRSSAPAVREVDAQPWAFVGLTAARFLLGIPFLYAFMRPTLPVASLLVLATPADTLREPTAPSLPVDG